MVAHRLGQFDDIPVEAADAADELAAVGRRVPPDDIETAQVDAGCSELGQFGGDLPPRADVDEEPDEGLAVAEFDQPVASS